jgi:hypothetical protein
MYRAIPPAAILTIFRLVTSVKIISGPKEIMNPYHLCKYSQDVEKKIQSCIAFGQNEDFRGLATGQTEFETRGVVEPERAGTPFR